MENNFKYLVQNRLFLLLLSPPSLTSLPSPPKPRLFVSLRLLCNKKEKRKSVDRAVVCMCIVTCVLFHIKSHFQIHNTTLVPNTKLVP